jgi:hypothetical protein
MYGSICVEMSKNLKPSIQCAKEARTAQTVLSILTRAFHFKNRHIFLPQAVPTTARALWM